MEAIEYDIPTAVLSTRLKNDCNPQVGTYQQGRISGECITEFGSSKRLSCTYGTVMVYHYSGTTCTGDFTNDNVTITGVCTPYDTQYTCLGICVFLFILYTLLTFIFTSPSSKEKRVRNHKEKRVGAC